MAAMLFTNLTGHAYQVWFDLDWSKRAKNSEEKKYYMTYRLAWFGLAWAELSNSTHIKDLNGLFRVIQCNAYKSNYYDMYKKTDQWP